ncbi:MAG TPA: hypothetical protein DD001_19230 [Microcoleaceae bacterium UBA10368]|nr:hypothetical protein [Microcoleaceae cyanobacterium UBA10368]
MDFGNLIIVYSRSQALSIGDNLTLNRQSLLFISRPRSPLTPLNKGGTGIFSKSTPTPFFKGDLGG